MSDPISVVKYGAVIPVSWETLQPKGPRVITPEEEQRMREHRALVAAATKAWPAFVAALGAAIDPLARVVLDLHAIDEHGYCKGCEVYGYDAESPPWPCKTTTAVAVHLGIEGAEDMWLAEQARQ